MRRFSGSNGAPTQRVGRRRGYAHDVGLKAARRAKGVPNGRAARVSAGPPARTDLRRAVPNEARSRPSRAVAGHHVRSGRALGTGARPIPRWPRGPGHRNREPGERSNRPRRQILRIRKGRRRGVLDSGPAPGSGRLLHPRCDRRVPLSQRPAQRSVHERGHRRPGRPCGLVLEQPPVKTILAQLGVQ